MRAESFTCAGCSSTFSPSAAGTAGWAAWVDWLLPYLGGVDVERVEPAGAGVVICVAPRTSASACPACGVVTSRVHSRYERRLADQPIGGRPVTIHVCVRRFRCAAKGCAKSTFAEQIDGLTLPYSRRTLQLQRVLLAVAVALAGRGGARLAARLGVAISRCSLLRLIRTAADPLVGEVTAIGVDDWAWRKGHVYGTVIIDMHTHRPIEVLGDREKDTLAEWLRSRDGIEVICRDRASAYAEAASQAAPEATQVADRWHLWHNLCQAVEKTVARHYGDLTVPAAQDEPETEPGSDPPAQHQARPSEPAEGRLMTRTRERYAEVKKLRGEGASLATIGRTLRLDRRTVRRFAHAGSLDEVLVNAGPRASHLDTYKPYLRERFNSGCTDAVQLTKQITAQGYHGSIRTVRRYLEPFRDTMLAPPAAPKPPKTRTIVGWLTRRPSKLTDNEAQQLTEILERSPALNTTYQHVTGFAEILTTRQGHRLTDWMTAVDTDASPALRSFVAGLRRDLDAVTNALTLDWSSGAVEGQVNRIKMIKRHMYGRANFDLLRKRILLDA